MENRNFYSETKYCPRCNRYVRYLESVQACYCVECGSKVNLFSTRDRKAFLRALKDERRKPVGNQKRVS